jgi:hypothetical protein
MPARIGSRFLLISIVAISTVFTTGSARSQVVQRELRVFDIRLLVSSFVLNVESIPDPSIPGVEPADRVFEEESDAWSDDATFPDEDRSSDGLTDGGALCFEPHQVVEIVQLIASDSWSNSRNTIETVGSKMIVVQTPEVLARIESLLRTLESRTARLVSLEVAIVPASTLDETAKGWRNAGSSCVVAGDVLEKAVAHARDRAVYFCAQMREGTWGGLASRTRRCELMDLAVDETGVSPVVVPSIASIFDGAHVEALVHAVADLDSVRVDLRIGTIGPYEKSGTAKLARATLSLPRLGNDQIGSSILVPRARTVIVGAFGNVARGENANVAASRTGFVTLVRASTIIPRAPVVKLEVDVPRFLDVGALSQLFPDRWLDLESSYPSPREDDESSVNLDFMNGRLAAALGLEFEQSREYTRGPVGMSVLERVLDYALSRGPERTPGEARALRTVNGTVFVRGSAATHEHLRTRVELLGRQNLRMAQIDLWQGRITEDEVARIGSSGAVLEDEWLAKLESPTGRRIRVVGMLGAKLSMASVRSRVYVSGLTQVSGGTGSDVVEMSDPRVDAATHGVILNVRANAVSGFLWLQLDVRGRAADATRFGRTAKASAIDGDAGGRRANERLTVELPESSGVETWRHRLTVPIGKPMLLSVLPSNAGETGARAMIVVVTIIEPPPTKKN